MYQQITIVGNLGSDPEMRYTPNGVPVTNFRMAVNRRWTGQDGQQQDKTTWFRVTVWQRQAEIVSQYLTKGSQVLVVGEMEEPSTWTDREGNTRASLEVTGRTIKFMSGRDASSGSYSPNDASAPSGSDSGGGGEMSDEDIPF